MPHFATTTIPDCTGKILDGRYKFTDVIGSGSFGVVYRAIDESVQAEGGCGGSVAVKVVSKSNKKLRDVSHLRMEITLHKRASLLPGVVTLRATLEDDQLSYLVMDLCGGGNLGLHIEKHGPYTDQQRLRTTFLAIVDAVCDLHRIGIYHRDIKPGNILLSEDGMEVFLGDFGLATRSEVYSYFAGTRAYMPPELLHPNFDLRPSSAQSDVWALGVVLLNMVSGRVPWASASPYEPAYFAFVRDPHHLLDLYPVSPGLNRILRRMLRANPAIRMRLPDVRTALAELDVWLSDGAEAEADIGDGGASVEGKGKAKEQEKEGGEVLEDGPAGQDSKAKRGVGQWGEVREMARSTVLSEMDIVVARHAKREAVKQQHAWACTEVQAADPSETLDFSPNTAVRVAARTNGTGSKGSSSGKSSTLAMTPEDSDVVVEKRDIGERMREIVARVKFKFRSR